MKRVFPWLLILLTGCCPITLRGQHQVSIDQTLSNSSGPVVEMSLPPYDHCPWHAGKIAIIDVDGLLLNTDLSGPYSLGENPVALFREKLEAVAASPCVRAVVVRINSPGGDVTSTDIMWRDLQTFRKETRRPVVACLMNLGTSGGYYLATASDAIVAHPTTVTGGIGVVLNLYNLRDTMSMLSILPQAIKAGELIDIGSCHGALTPEARERLQQLADTFHHRFKAVVQQSRPAVNPADGTNFDGRVFSAEEALQRRLIDQIGYLDDAIALAANLGDCPKAQVVLYRRHKDPAHSIHSTSPNMPLHPSFLPVSIPGLDRSRLPLFLYMWQPDTTLLRLGGR